MTRLFAAASAAMLSLALVAGVPAVAQEQTADAVMTGMAELGMDTEGLVLTEDQVLQIQTILNGTNDDNEKVDEINQLLGM